MASIKKGSQVKDNRSNNSSDASNCVLQVQNLSVIPVDSGNSFKSASNNKNKELHADFHGLWKANYLLKKANICIPPQSITYLVGPNGAGKSVLLNTIAGNPLLEVVNGKILYNGKDITNLQAYERAKLGVFMIFQRPVQIPEITVMQYFLAIYESMQGNDQLNASKLTDGDQKDLFKSLLKRVGLPASILNKPLNVDISGGQQKKLEVATMLLVKPKLVLIDELDSGLDIDSEKLLFGIIKNYLEQQKATAIVVSHNFRSLGILPADRVYIVKDGVTSGPFVSAEAQKVLRRVKQEGFAN